MESKGHLALLCDAGEMFALLSGEPDTEKILQRCVCLVAQHLEAQVCSIYFLARSENELRLQATTGLNPDSVGVVRMKVGEGLVGKAMENKEMILEDHASRNPDFKYFPDANEEAFECFLAIPILRGEEGIGVMVTQRVADHPFTQDEAMVLRSIASQLAVLIENARVLISLKMDLDHERTTCTPNERVDERPPGNTISAIEGDNAGRAATSGMDGAGMRDQPQPMIFPARIASQGIAVGRAVVAKRSPVLEMLRGNRAFTDDPSLGLNALERAIKESLLQIERLEKGVAKRLPEAVTLIFDAHIMILKDKGFSEKMRELTREGNSALSSVVTVAQKYMKLFGASPNDYLREKVADVEDIASRLIENLLKPSGGGEVSHEDKILIARDLLPSAAVRFAMEGVAGIVLTGGGIASHAAILARSLNIPMVITETLAPLRITSDTVMVVDGEVGNIYLNPTPEIQAQFQEQMQYDVTTDRIPEKMTQTADGVPINLMVNINLLSELDSAVRLNAQGIGLYRSEFPFLVRNNFPSDMEQFKVYDMLFSKMAGKEVTIRTLDVGGDKVLSYFDNAGETNPELGLRSIRFAFRYPEIMKTQIRAILTAYDAAEDETTLRIKFPMVSSLDEFRRAKKIVMACYEGLGAPSWNHLTYRKVVSSSDEGDRETGAMNGRNGVKPGEDGDYGTMGKMKKPLPQIGMMLELPSVVELIDDLANEVDFFSIGTNDFVQYMLAADRANDRVADYYTPHHPSVLRALSRIAKAVTHVGKDLSVCGEMAKEPAFIPFFLGIGIRKLSVNQQFLYSVQQCIAKWSLPDAKAYAQLLLAQNSVEGVAKVLAE